MKIKTLVLIKKEIRELHPIALALAKYYKSDNYATISTLLQNAGFDISSSTGFDLIKAEKELYEILNILKLIAEYKDSHFENWIYAEVNNIINTHVSDENTVGYLVEPTK